MPRPVPPRPPDAWTLFGRWRRPSPLGRGLGLALLVLSSALTVLWANDARSGPAHPGAESVAGGAAGGAVAGAATPPPASTPTAATPTSATPPGPPTCAAGAPADARPLTLPLGAGAARPDPWAPWLGEVVCLTHPLVVAEVYELPTQRRILAAAERPWATTPADALLRGALLVRPTPGAARARLLPAQGDAAPGPGGGTGGGTTSGAGVAAAASGSGPWGLGGGELRNGDALEGLYGRLQLEAGRVVLEAPALTVRRLNPRPPPPARPEARPPGGESAGATPAAIGGGVRVAGLNLSNWFVTLGDRGADTPEARDRQATKLVAALLALDADALALAEVENDGGAALDDLLRRLNEAQRAAARDPAADYVAARAPPGGGERDATRVAIAYRPAALTLIRTDVDGATIHDRAPLAAAFALPGGRPAFTLLAAHHKAKGGCPTTGDVDRGSGCWDLRRDAQSQALLDFAARLTRGEEHPPVLLVGDLNAYRHEAPARRFAEAGWRVLVDDMPPERAYSYVYFGRAGALDHAIAEPALAPRVSVAAFWPINADEPPRADASLPTPYRASDHDPILVDLRWD